MRQRNCPICNSEGYKTIFTQHYDKDFSHRIVSCQQCGFIYVNNIKPQSFYNEYYSKMSKYETTRDSELHEDSIEIIKRYAKKNDKLLDIGCATGHLLHLLKTNGYKKLLGVDPAPKCSEVAKSEYNINVKTSTIESYKTEDKYDFIILSAVVEHLEEVQSSIKKISSLLKKDGLVFISVPNAGNFYQGFEEPFGEFSIEHINFFSSLHLHQLMDSYSCLYMRSDNVAIYSVWQYISSPEESLKRYIKESQKRMNHINKVINESASKLVVWGAGSLTMRLLQTTNLGKKVVTFVDKNENLLGTKIGNIPVISPEELSKYSYPILISSFKFKDEISKEIKQRKLPNQIITF